MGSAYVNLCNHSVSQAEKEKREAQQKLEEANKKANEAQQKLTVLNQR